MPEFVFFAQRTDVKGKDVDSDTRTQTQQFSIRVTDKITREEAIEKWKESNRNWKIISDLTPALRA